MSFEWKNSSNNEKKEKKEDEMLSFEKMVGEFKFSISVERGNFPMRVKVDWDDKKVIVSTTPRGIREAWGLIRNLGKYKGDLEDILSAIEKDLGRK